VKRLSVMAALLLVMLTGCAIQPSSVMTGEEAPTGVAAGVTLYFVDDEGALRPQVRETGRLGTIVDAVSLLLTGPGHSGLHTEIAQLDNTLVQLLSSEGTISLQLPLSRSEVTQTGIDQIVCTALASHLQAGGPRSTTVTLRFTIPQPGSDDQRRCPLLL
jgi:hypothetical protein